MKFPKVTVVLVAASLLYVLWHQTRDQAEPIDASRLTNLQANPVELGSAVDWIFSQIPEFCRNGGEVASGTEPYETCIQTAEARTSSCRRMLYDRFPATVASDALFRDMTLTAMECLIPRSGLVE
ncbi:MAG: hypothetical protein VX324_06830 [Pseudomonadota bacterium]|nr:hypothetical protein [Pseudomonadota bacterium]